MIVGAAVVVMALSSSPGGATPPSGLANVQLALGTNASTGPSRSRGGTNVAMAQITVSPGGASGWHSHPGGAIVVVQQGSLTVYEAVGDRCEIARYSVRRSSSDLAKWIKSSTGTVPYTCTSPSRGCLQVHRRGPTNRTRARVQVSDDLTE